MRCSTFSPQNVRDGAVYVGIFVAGGAGIGGGGGRGGGTHLLHALVI